MKTLKNFSRQVLLLTVVLAASMLVACGKKSDSSTGAIPAGPAVVPPYGCNGCIGNQQPLLIGVQGSHSLISMGLDFFGDANLGYNLQDPKAITVYQGPLTIQGNAIVRNLCGANGNYSLRTLNPGTIAWGSVSGNSMLAPVGFSYPSARMTLEGVSQSGGPNIVIQVAHGQLYNTGMEGLSLNSQTNRIGLNFGVIVGGQPCGDISTY
jgi:hypothetical protein